MIVELLHVFLDRNFSAEAQEPNPKHRRKPKHPEERRQSSRLHSEECSTGVGIWKDGDTSLSPTGCEDSEGSSSDFNSSGV